MDSADPSRLRQVALANDAPWIVIDEIQKIPQLLNEVHYLISKHDRCFILTGSSARKLRQADVNLLAGRARTFYMHGLTAVELGADFDLTKALTLGMLPEVQTTSDPKYYLEAASFSQGAVLNVTEIARECGLNRMTVENYFGILEDLLIAHRLDIFSKCAKRKLISQKKFYFFDCGVFNMMRPKGILDSVHEVGGIALETLVFQELRAINDYYNYQYSIHYWRTKHGVEVDFVLYGEKGFFAFEVKKSKTITPKDLRGLKTFLTDYPEAKAFIIYDGPYRESFGDITAIPVAEFLLSVPTILSDK